jgi:hypothetical protein
VGTAVGNPEVQLQQLVCAQLAKGIGQQQYLDGVLLKQQSWMQGHFAQIQAVFS